MKTGCLPRLTPAAAVTIGTLCKQAARLINTIPLSLRVTLKLDALQDIV